MYLTAIWTTKKKEPVNLRTGQEKLSKLKTIALTDVAQGIECQLANLN